MRDCRAQAVLRPAGLRSGQMLIRVHPRNVGSSDQQQDEKQTRELLSHGIVLEFVCLLGIWQATLGQTRSYIMPSASVTQIDVDVLLHRARFFYKGPELKPDDHSSAAYIRYKQAQLKSSNKSYPSPRLEEVEKDPADPKYLARKANIQKSRAALKAFREWFNNSSPLLRDYGSELLSEGMRAGNCMEMTAVVISIFTQDALLRSKFEKVYLAYLNDPGDHGFAVLSVDGSAPKWMNISAMLSGSESYENNFWAVDCWFNIASPAHLFCGLVRQKLQKWEAAGKMITAKSERGPGSTRYYPNSEAYSSMLLNSRLDYIEQ